MRLKRHAIVVGTSVVIGTVIYQLLGFNPEWWPDRSFGRRADDVHWKSSVSTGSTAMLLLGTTLSIGPLQRLRTGRKGPIHIPWRRTVGVWAAVVAWTHVLFGVTIHADGWRIWVPFTHLWVSQGKLRILAASMWIGLGATLILIVLALTSNSFSLRTLGAKRWKLLQRGSYVVGALVVVHIAGIQVAESRNLPHVAITFGVLTMFATLRLISIVRNRTPRTEIVVEQRLNQPTGGTS